MAKQWQPYYLAYCNAHGRKPVAMMKFDRCQWPGGVNTGFILWMSERWRVYRHMINAKPNDPLSEAEHQRFGEWLKEVCEPTNQNLRNGNFVLFVDNPS